MESPLQGDLTSWTPGLSGTRPGGKEEKGPQEPWTNLPQQPSGMGGWEKDVQGPLQKVGKKAKGTHSSSGTVSGITANEKEGDFPLKPCRQTRNPPEGLTGLQAACQEVTSLRELMGATPEATKGCSGTPEGATPKAALSKVWEGPPLQTHINNGQPSDPGHSAELVKEKHGKSKCPNLTLT